MLDLLLVGCYNALVNKDTEYYLKTTKEIVEL